MINPMNLTGKNVLVIGTSTGVDKSILDRLDELGAVVSQYNPLTINSIESDLRSIVSERGSFDGIVYTIIHSDFRPIQYTKPDVVEEILRDNFVFFLESVRCLRKSKGLKDRASIVALSSISSIRAMKAKTAFCASKAAMDASIRCLAAEFADKQIRVNSIQKGVVDVDFEKAHIQDVALINEGAAEKLTLLGVTKSMELANLVAFLLSDALTTMTGVSLVLDGGYTL